VAKNTSKTAPSVSLDDVISAMKGIGQNIATLAESVAAQNARIDTLERIATAPKQTPQSKDAGRAAPKTETVKAAHPETDTVKGTVTRVAASHKGIQIDSVTGWLNVSKECAPFFTTDRVVAGDKVKLSIEDGLVTGMTVRRAGKSHEYAVESMPEPTTGTVMGTVSATYRGGMSAQLKETGTAYYNATKAAGPIFKDIAAGTRVEIDAILAEGSQPKATAVRIVKDAGKTGKTGKTASKDAGTKAAAPSKTESVTMSLAADSDDGCEFCGAKHGKNGKAIVVLECSIRQYMKDTGIRLDVQDDVAMMAYMEWRMARIIEVSVSREESAILKGSKYVAPKTETKRGRPKGSKNAPKDAPKGKARR